MKEKYIDLMEKALSAYSDEHILRYFNQVSLGNPCSVKPSSLT